MRILDPTDWADLPWNVREYWMAWYNRKQERIMKGQG
jgi:hypothetical protein